MVVSSLIAMDAIAQGPNSPARSTDAAPQTEPMVLDLKTGSIFGASLGMDEAAARDALVEHHVTGFQKHDQEQPKQFSLDTLLGVTLWFPGSQRHLRQLPESLAFQRPEGGPNDSGLHRAARPSTRKLPSRKHTETLYQVGPFDLGAISVDTEPDVVRAMRVLKRER
jgi:hypothetical protein